MVEFVLDSLSAVDLDETGQSTGSPTVGKAEMAGMVAGTEVGMAGMAAPVEMACGLALGLPSLMASASVADSLLKAA
ncbi:hypothetical protein BBR01nite_46810 [Brevibacillus brevis]|nr:hypothetical protein BBR01nite_46810 [Brevibacillus brevis]